MHVLGAVGVHMLVAVLWRRCLHMSVEGLVVLVAVVDGWELCAVSRLMVVGG